MKNKESILISVIFFLSLFVSNLTLADDTILGGAGQNVWPIISQDISMEQEVVRIKLGKKKVLVEAAFTFKNEGSAKEILIGFPSGDKGTEVGKDAVPGHSLIHDFKTYVNGKEVKAEKRRGLNNPDLDDLSYFEWLVRKIKFEPNEAKILKNSYWTEYSVSPHHLSFEYVIKTGRVWKGPIKKAIFIIDSRKWPPEIIEHVSHPQNFSHKTCKDGIVRLEYDNLEPDKNIRIGMANLRDYESTYGLKYLEKEKRFVFDSEISNIAFETEGEKVLRLAENLVSWGGLYPEKNQQKALAELGKYKKFYKKDKSQQLRQREGEIISLKNIIIDACNHEFYDVGIEACDLLEKISPESKGFIDDYLSTLKKIKKGF